MQIATIKFDGRKLALLVLGGIASWFILTAIFSVSNYIDASRVGRNQPYIDHFIGTAYGFGVWGIAGPLLFACASSASFVEAHWQKKLLYIFLAGLLVTGIVLLYIIFVTAPRWNLEPLVFLKHQKIVDWLGDMFLFVIAMLLGYVSAVIQKAQQAALAAAKLQSTLAQEQAERNAREATYLRGRLGSHFVMNALSNVLGLMRLGDTARAEDATILLSDILRGMTADGTGNLVSLATEMTLAEKYLAFQRIRYPSLETNFDVEPATLCGMVPGQLLQPLLENVFKHATLPQVAVLKVAAHVDGDHIELSVANNSTAPQADTQGVGEGMTLTTLRLKTLMKGAVTVHRAYADGWYKVTLRVPFMQDNEGAL